MTDIDSLRARVAGPVLVPGDADLPAQAATVNLAVTHHPAVVAGATSAADVAAAVGWAAAAGLAVAVQATGHGPVEPADGALLITTGRMQGVSVDPDRRLATAAAGSRWSDVVPLAAEHGLAPLSGSTSHVGVVGYTLGGGIGHLSREYGFAADLVTRVELVTADGTIRQVTAESDPELFWAVRGGKANFGIVTEIEFGLQPVESLVGGSVFYPGAAAPAVLHAWADWTRTLPDRTTTSIALLRLPDVEEVPAPMRGTLTVHLRYAHHGPPAESDELLAPMLAAGPVLMSDVRQMPYPETDSISNDPTEPAPGWDRGVLLRDLDAAAVDAVLGVAGPDADSPLTLVELRHLGGALGRPAAVPDAVAGRDAAYSVFVVGLLLPQLAEVVPAAGQAVFAAVGPWRTPRSALLNIVGPVTPEQLGAAWSTEDHRRLLAVKDAVDPGNVFRVGHHLR